MEKRANNSLINMKYKSIFIILLLLLGGYTQAQTKDFIKGKKYVLDSIGVSGLKTYNAQTVISFSGLRKGQEISLPGDEISGVLNKLWGLELFSDISFFVTKVEGRKIAVEIEIEELPTLSDVKINGIKKGQTETIISDTELKAGKKISESFMTNTQNYLENKYRKDGFLNTKVTEEKPKVAKSDIFRFHTIRGVESLKSLENSNNGGNEMTIKKKKKQ